MSIVNHHPFHLATISNCLLYSLNAKIIPLSCCCSTKYFTSKESLSFLLDPANTLVLNYLKSILAVFIHYLYRKSHLYLFNN